MPEVDNEKYKLGLAILMQDTCVRKVMKSPQIDSEWMAHDESQASDTSQDSMGNISSTYIA